jgi:hypothetical protein
VKPTCNSKSIAPWFVRSSRLQNSPRTNHYHLCLNAPRKAQPLPSKPVPLPSCLLTHWQLKVSVSLSRIPTSVALRGFRVKLLLGSAAVKATLTWLETPLARPATRVDGVRGQRVSGVHTSHSSSCHHYLRLLPHTLSHPQITLDRQLHSGSLCIVSMYTLPLASGHLDLRRRRHRSPEQVW